MSPQVQRVTDVKLYHGTSGSAGRKILDVGLQPRSFLSKRKGNWHHTVPSNPKAVYLTSVYAPYFAAVAAGDETELAIVEIDAEALDTDFLFPDEDFLEQASRGQTLEGREFKTLRACGADMKKRTRWFRDNITSFGHLWEKSVEGMGTCCYYAPVGKRAISRVSFIQYKDAMQMLGMAMDPMISILNFRFCAGKYRALTQWFMGDTVKAQNILDFAWDMTPENQRLALQNTLNNQSMITVV